MYERKYACITATQKRNPRLLCELCVEVDTNCLRLRCTNANMRASELLKKEREREDRQADRDREKGGVGGWG